MGQSRTIPSFQRWLHRIYRRNSAVTHFLHLRIRPTGVLLILLIPITWMTLPLHTIAALFQLRGLIFVLLSIAFVWTLLRRASISASRQLPRHATAEEPVEYLLHIENIGHKTIAGANLIELPPDNRPDLELFTLSREPGEETRNSFDRVFAYHRWEWLQRSLTLFDQNTPAQLTTLKPGETTTLSLSITPKKRGIITLNNLRLGLPDPFGIFQRIRKTTNTSDKIIVLPKRYPIPPIQLPGNAHSQLGGDASSNSIGQSGDYTSVRDYRPGDPPRHIHWKSWARTGRPIVKEYEDVFYPRYGLMLDTFTPQQDAEKFEQAVSVAASFAASIDTRDTLLDLMFIHDKAFSFTAGRGEERIDRMLEVLAGVSPSPSNDFQALENLVLSHQNDLSACICIYTGWCEQRQSIIRKLNSAGIKLQIICICQDRETAGQQLRQHPSPLPVQLLRTNHIQEDLNSAPTHLDKVGG